MPHKGGGSRIDGTILRRAQDKPTARGGRPIAHVRAHTEQQGRAARVSIVLVHLRIQAPCLPLEAMSKSAFTGPSCQNVEVGREDFSLAGACDPAAQPGHARSGLQAC